MARGNCKPNKPCGMSQGIYNPFFQGGQPWYGQGLDDLGAGLLKDILTTSGNRSANIKLRIAPTTYTGTLGYNPASTYSFPDTREWPPNSDLQWISSAAIAINEVPGINSKWKMAAALDMIQDSGDGVHYFRSMLQRNVDGFCRLHGFQYGTIADGKFVLNASNYIPNGNYDGNGTFASTSSTSHSVPAPLLSRTITIGTGFTIPNSTSVGTCTDNFAIPTTTPTYMTRNLPAGLGLVMGNYVTFYGNASNLFVFVVVTYNNSTGVAYGFMTLKVGSGTFSSWSLKTEKLLHVYRTNDDLGTNWTGLVQSYDSGTGSLTMISVATTGSGTQSNWTVVTTKTPNDAASTQSQAFNLQSAPLGCWFTGTQTYGTYIRHRCITDNRGTKWRYIYVDGPNRASPPAEVVIDTYSVGTVTNTGFDIWSGLLPGTVSDPHKFIAVSEASASGTNIKAWVYASTTAGLIPSFGIGYNYDVFTPSVDVCFDSQSLGETVFKYAPNDQAHTNATTWPYHGDLSDTNTSRVFTVDGATINVETTDPTVNPYLYKYQSFTTASVVQAGFMYHKDWPAYGNFAKYDSKHTFNRNGVTLDYLRMELLQTTWIDQWYANLFAMLDAYIYPGRVIAESGEAMEWPAEPSGFINMSSTFKGQRSYKFISDNYPLYCVVDYWPDTSNWRIGQANRGPDHIENLSGISSKFRPYPSFDRVGASGEVYTIKNRKYFGHRGSL